MAGNPKEYKGVLKIGFGISMYPANVRGTRGVSTHPTDVSVASVAYRIRR